MSESEFQCIFNAFYYANNDSERPERTECSLQHKNPLAIAMATKDHHKQKLTTITAQKSDQHSIM